MSRCRRNHSSQNMVIPSTRAALHHPDLLVYLPPETTTMTLSYPETAPHPTLHCTGTPSLPVLHLSKPLKTWRPPHSALTGVPRNMHPFRNVPLGRAKKHPSFGHRAKALLDPISCPQNVLATRMGRIIYMAR